MALRRERMRLGDILIKQHIITEDQLKKALELNLPVIVCINKIDRPEARPERHDHRRDDRPCTSDAAWTEGCPSVRSCDTEGSA